MRGVLTHAAPPDLPSPPPPPLTSCATPEVLELLGNGGATEQNVMQYLGVVEQRTSEMVQARLWLGSARLRTVSGCAAAVGWCANHTRTTGTTPLAVLPDAGGRGRGGCSRACGDGADGQARAPRPARLCHRPALGAAGKPGDHVVLVARYVVAGADGLLPPLPPPPPPQSWCRRAATRAPSRPLTLPATTRGRARMMTALWTARRWRRGRDGRQRAAQRRGR